MQTQTNTQKQVPVVAAVVTHDVENYEVWKRAFDGHAAARKNAGIVAAHVNRHADNPNRLSVYLAATDSAKLDAFFSSTELMSTMREAGVKGPPHIAKVTPVEDLTVKDRALPGVIVRHEVADFGAWKRAFDEHGATRAKAGVLGHAVNRSRENTNVVVVYLQAESLDALRAFASAADLKQTMQAAGVIGAPELTFVQGGEWV
jgi:quinol monooxygenase YgiN